MTCSVEGCTRRARCRGWCKPHYERWRIRGTLDPYVPPTTEERFLSSFTVVESGCWLWTGEISHNGYGRHVIARHAGTNNPVRQQAHVFSYERFVGPVPAGYHVDHLCHVRNCVNPLHLEAVTPRENNLRSASPSAQNARKTHCSQGHPLSGDNVFILRARPRSRGCRECRRLASERYRLRNRAA